jgi:small multidrug resistance family-3 protein
MQAWVTPLLLLIAAVLEVGGDAIVRAGLKGHTGVARVAFLAIGAIVLFGYGVFVNTAPADFGRLLGIYVVLFFIIAQLVNFFAFGVRPGMGIIGGGALIIAGGIVISAWKT